MVKTQLICEPIRKRLLTKHSLRRFAVKYSKKYSLLFIELRYGGFWHGKANFFN
jgi:hypothetical protein